MLHARDMSSSHSENAQGSRAAKKLPVFTHHGAIIVEPCSKPSIRTKKLHLVIHYEIQTIPKSTIRAVLCTKIDEVHPREVDSCITSESADDKASVCKIEKCSFTAIHEQEQAINQGSPCSGILSTPLASPVPPRTQGQRSVGPRGLQLNRWQVWSS